MKIRVLSLLSLPNFLCMYALRDLGKIVVKNKEKSVKKN